ncbi:MAG: acyl-CoA thioesterase [Ignavibacteriae bacterium]|nr:acyl-CoA thioesterase [Ignavibacteriota bacterium]
MSQSITISHTSTVRVRYADTDKMGIVYNGNYLTYFEIGRTELLRAIELPYSELEKQGCLLPVSEAKVQYKIPAVYDDILDITATFRYSIHAASITIEYSIMRGNDCIAIGYTTHPFLNATTRRPMRPPKLFVDAVLGKADGF